MRKLKKYYSELRHRRDSIGPLPLDIAVQENQLNNRPNLNANNPELDNNDVGHSLQIQLNEMTEEMHKLTERMDKYEIEFPAHTDLV